jgi:hypothetical protein
MASAGSLGGTAAVTACQSSRQRARAYVLASQWTGARAWMQTCVYLSIHVAIAVHSSIDSQQTDGDVRQAHDRCSMERFSREVPCECRGTRRGPVELVYMCMHHAATAEATVSIL